MNYPNKLRAMVRACGKYATDLSAAMGSNCPTAAHRYTTGQNRPTLAMAEKICAVLSEWAGREVPVSAIFPDVFVPAYHGKGSGIDRDEAAIAAILGDSHDD